jgi:hypothetical protein
MKTHSLAALAVALSLASGTASAQDSAPVIRELQIDNQKVTSVPQGGVVTAIGRNFHNCPALPAPVPGQPPPRNTCRHEELKVQVNNDDVLLLESTFERVTFIVPQDTAIGRKRLKISIRGRGEATFEFDVAAQLTEEQRRKQADTEGGAGRAPDVEELIREQFRITMFELKRDAAGARFEVAGVAGKVPDGFSMVITLSINQRDIEQMLTSISNQGGQANFRVTFGPYTKELLFGNYAATCLFELSKQPRARVRQFRRDLKADEAQVYDRIERREFLQVGTAQEVTDQTTAMQNHYRTHADDLGKLLTDLEKAYGAGCRQHFKQPGQANYDEAAWTTYITQMGFVPPNDANALNAFKNDFRFATRNGHFKPDDYATWANDTFLPALQGAFKKHRDFRDSTIAPIEPRGELPADYLVSIVLETFKEYTKNLYERAKIELPENLRMVANVDPVPAQTISRRFFDAQKRLLLRTVGLRHLVPEGGD